MAQTAKTTKRVMFVWLPNFAMSLARLKQPQLAKPDEPLALIEKHGNIRRIAALDAPAIHAGLYLHQPLSDALAIYPNLICAEAEGCEDSLTAIATWARRYSPATAPAPPCGLWLDITGCSHLWGGEARLVEDLLQHLQLRGITARAAIAPTFGAAYALAHHTDHYFIAASRLGSAHLNVAVISGGVPTVSQNPQSSHEKLEAIPTGERKAQVNQEALESLLAPLPVERLRLKESTNSALGKLGLFTIGDVQKLPRSGLSRRFPDLIPQLDKATGVSEEAIDFLRPVEPWIGSLRFAEPISAPEDLERVAMKLLEMLCRRLQAGRQGGMRFELSFYRCDGEVQSQTVSTALPARDAARIFRLFREKLGLIDPGFGIDVAALTALHVEPLEDRQANLIREHKSSASLEELAALIDALENRLGKGRVYRLDHKESYIPERGVKRVQPLDKTSWQSATQAMKQKHTRSKTNSLTVSIKDARGNRVWDRLSERPVRLFARPQPIDVTAALPDAPPVLFRWRKVLHRVARADGPERISPEWWRQKECAEEDSQTRDYYRVESTQGLRFWVFREGLYGGSGLPRWYLHGVFA